MPFNPHEFLSKSRIHFFEPSTKREILEKLVDSLATSPFVQDKKDLLEKILEREETLSTGVGSGLALPHAKIESIEDFVVSVGICKEGIDFDSLDHKPAHIFLMIGCNNSQAGEYIKLLGKCVKSLREKHFQEMILASEKPEEVYDLLTGPEGIH